MAMRTCPFSDNVMLCVGTDGLKSKKKEIEQAQKNGITWTTSAPHDVRPSDPLPTKQATYGESRGSSFSDQYYPKPAFSAPFFPLRKIVTFPEK